MSPLSSPVVIVVGGGGVGKTTLAAALAVASAAKGDDTLVMTFDPSLRLKDTLGVGAEARDHEVRVDATTPGRLDASLLDARRTFDRLIARYAPDDAARKRILANRFYDHLSANLAGVLEYMASERLFEVAELGTWKRIILDTPPTRQALDFLAAPQRIVSFLDSGALRIALKPWFDDHGRLRATSRFGFVGRNVESFLDRIVGLEVLRDMAEFFQAFAPLFDGFGRRALKVQEMLRSPQTVFMLVSGPGQQRIADTLFFARRLKDEGYRLGPVVVNRVHPPPRSDRPQPRLETAARDGAKLISWLGSRDRQGIDELASLLAGSHPLVELPLLPEEPTDLATLAKLGSLLEQRLHASSR
jgi:anion-transporting  ArsA/GET3 family ATPase